MRPFLTSMISAAFICTFGSHALAQDITISFSDDALEEFSETYGEREMEVLTTSLNKRLKKVLDKENLNISKIDLIIEDAAPNRPTREQVSQRPGLDQFRSVSLGGAKITGTAYAENGEILATSTIKRYAHSIHDAKYQSTWGDAKRAFSVFSKRMVKDIRNG